jgi:hypothetical protein
MSECAAVVMVSVSLLVLTVARSALDQHCIIHSVQFSRQQQPREALSYTVALLGRTRVAQVLTAGAIQVKGIGVV